MSSSSSNASNLTFVPFSMEKTKTTSSSSAVDTAAIQFVDQSKSYSKYPVVVPQSPPTSFMMDSHVKPANSASSQYSATANTTHTNSTTTTNNLPPNTLLPPTTTRGTSPTLVHASGMPKLDHRRASVHSLSASVTSNSSLSDNSTDSSSSTNSKTNQHTLESQTFQFKVHEKEQQKLVFYNFTKEQIDKKRKYVRKKPVKVAVQTIEESTTTTSAASPSVCGKRKASTDEAIVNSTVPAASSSTTSPPASSPYTIPTISLTDYNTPPPPPPFVPSSKRRTSISIAELLN